MREGQTNPTETTMRFLMMVKMDGRTEMEAVANARRSDLEAMGRYNQSLRDAGVLLAVDGLLDSSFGSRVTYEAGGSKVTDGPFTESKELVAGFWMLQVKSKAEALEWARKIPFFHGESVELRQIA